MPVAWYLAPYKRGDLPGGRPARYCAMDDFTPQIVADGGWWAESEGLGDHAVVRVRASAATLTLIDGTTGFVAVPKRWVRLLDSLSDMTSGERNQIQNKLLSLGYTQAQIDAALGSTLSQWRQKTLRDLLAFACSRRRKPRYDAATDTIFLDGPDQPTRAVESVVADVPE